MVHARPSVHASERIVDYLACHTHRIALDEARLPEGDGEQVTLRYRHYAQRGQFQTLDGAEFIRRFLLHILPQGFVRVRHYGFLANLLPGQTPRPNMGGAQSA